MYESVYYNACKLVFMKVLSILHMIKNEAIFRQFHWAAFLVSFVSKGLYKIHILQVFFPVSGLYLHFCNPCFETKINVIKLNGSFSGQDIFSLWPILLSLE